MFKKKELFIVFLLIAIFVFLRVYRIQESLLFFNDIGRDFLVLFKWNQTGKPPLLGPQTSALPFNQSAFYFYLLYPFYLITGHSPYASILALIVFYLFFFVTGVFFLKKDKNLRYSLYFVFFLLSIHPQYIKQARFVWNPSFVTPFLLTAFYSFIRLKKDFEKRKSLSWKLTSIFALSISLAASFSYSAAPTMIAFAILAIFYFKKESWKMLPAFAVSLAFINIATIAFEFRHGFLLSQMLLTRENPPQPDSYLMAKLFNFNRYCFVSSWQMTVLFLLVLLIAIIFLWKRKKKINFELKFAFILFILTFLILLIAPIAIQAHYIFGLLPIFFLLLVFLSFEKKAFYIFPIILLLTWVTPENLNSYFSKAYRTVAESEACARSFCESHQEPLFVSVQSDRHPYHNAMEWQYMLAENGCNLKDLTTETELADYMAVFADDSNYTHGETAFNELTIFGKSKEIEEFVCNDKLKIHYLEKNK